MIQCTNFQHACTLLSNFFFFPRSLSSTPVLLLFFARRGHWALSPAPSGCCRLPPAPTGCCHQRPPGAVTSAQRLLSTSASARRLLSTSASAQKPRLPFTQRVNGLRHTLPTYLEGEAHSWSNEERERENWNTVSWKGGPPR